MKNRHEILNNMGNLIVAVQDDPRNDEAFCRMVFYLHNDVGVCVSHIANMFEVCRITVQRWISGISAPHPLARRQVCREFLTELKDLKKIHTNNCAKEFLRGTGYERA